MSQAMRSSLSGISADALVGASLKNVDHDHDSHTDSQVQALAHASIKAGGEIAADVTKVRGSLTSATLLTQHAIKSNGIVSAPANKGPNDTAKARQMALVALNSGKVKSAVGAPDTSPSAEQLAAIQKEGNETRAAIEEEKSKDHRKIDARTLSGVALKKAEKAEEKTSETMARAGMLNEITKGGIISADPAKTRRASLTDKHVGTAIMHNEIKKMGVISVPADKAPDTALTTEQLAALQLEAKKEKEEDGGASA